MKNRTILFSLIVPLVFAFISVTPVSAGDLGLKLGGQEIGLDIYGKLHASTDYLDDGEDNSLYVSSNSSRLGFKGGVNLEQLELIWQIESLVNLDESGSTLATRNSYVGLSNEAAGTIFWGRHDTPMKTVGRKVDFFGDRIGDSRNLIGAAGAGFNMRASNLITYITPDLSGVTATIAYGAEEGTDKGDLVSGSLTYKQGGLYLGAAAEQHNEAWGESGEEAETGLRLAAKYAMEEVAIGGLYEVLQDTDGVSGADRNTGGLGIAYTPGGCDATLKGQWYMTDGIDGMDDTETNMFVVGVDYALADSTTLYLVYAIADNEDAASTGVSGGGHGDTVTPVAGKDPYGIGLGIIYKF